MAENVPAAAMDRMSFWILDEDGRTPVCAGFERGLAWMSERDGIAQRVAETKIGSVTVSTVFISIMAFDDAPPRLGMTEGRLFETASFEADEVRVHTRYATWDEAERGHAEVVRAIEAATPRN